MARKATKRMSNRTIGLAVLGSIIGAGAAAFAAFRFRNTQGVGHKAPDLALDADRPGTGERAPDAFRPDPAAPVPASEREAFRPVTTPVPAPVDRESIALN